MSQSDKSLSEVIAHLDAEFEAITGGIEEDLDFIDRALRAQEAERLEARKRHEMEFGRAALICRRLQRYGIKAYAQKGASLRVVIEEDDFDGLEALLSRAKS